MSANQVSWEKALLNPSNTTYGGPESKLFFADPKVLKENAKYANTPRAVSRPADPRTAELAAHYAELDAERQAVVPAAGELLRGTRIVVPTAQELLADLQTPEQLLGQ